MKTLSFFFALFCISTVFAAAPEFQSTFLNALEENNPKVRVVKLINALEKSPTAQSDENVLKLLAKENNSGNIDASGYRMLQKMMKKKPANFQLALFCMNHADRSLPFPAELLDVFEQNLRKCDLAKLEKKQYYSALDAIAIYAKQRRFRKEFTKLDAFCDHLLKQYPNDLFILERVIYSAVNSCFIRNLTMPGHPSFAALPAEDICKKQITALGGKLLKMPIANAAEADLLIRCACLLHLPETPQLLQKYSKLYPAHRWPALSATVAKTFEKPELLILSNDVFSDFAAMLSCGNIAGAQKLLDSIAKDLRKELVFELQLLLWSADGDFCKINNAVNTGKIDPQKPALGNITLHNIINAAHVQKDRDLLLRLLVICSRGKFNASLLNAIGYVCADLGLELPAAEKMIRLAVKAEPYNSAYRDSLAWVLFKQGKFAEAEKEINNALSFSIASPSVSVMLLHAAEIKFALKKFDEAKVLLALAVRLYDPDDASSAEYDLKAEKRLLRALQ